VFDAGSFTHCAFAILKLQTTTITIAKNIFMYPDKLIDSLILNWQQNQDLH
jgi:hypothetical protein